MAEMDAILVPHPAGGFIPAWEAFAAADGSAFIQGGNAFIDAAANPLNAFVVGNAATAANPLNAFVVGNAATAANPLNAFVVGNAAAAANPLNAFVVGNAAAAAGNPAGNALNAGLVDGDGFTRVVSRKYGRQRGVNRGLEDVPPEPDHICDRVFEWYPKSGNLKWVRKWSQARKGGTIGTAEGEAIITYPCYPPASTQT